MMHKTKGVQTLKTHNTIKWQIYVWDLFVRFICVIYESQAQVVQIYMYTT